MAAVFALAPPAFAAAADEARLVAAQGEAREAQGAHDEALADLTRAIEMHKLPAAEQAQLLFERGLILDTQGRLADAVGDYSAALTLAPHFAPAFNNRANAFRRQGRLGDAKRDYLASLAAGNFAPEYSWYGLGQVAEAQGNAAAARDDYARAVAANPAYRLAADRLAAVGGHSPAGADTGVIHLRPPGSVLAAIPKPPVAANGGDSPIQLHPPRSRIAPARYAPQIDPGLRPALDNAPLAGPQVQLGAWRSEDEAAGGWNKAMRQADGLLNGLSPHIVVADLPGKGRYYRLRAGPVVGAPARLCEALTARGVDCIPARD